MRKTVLTLLFLVLALGISVQALADSYTIGTGTSTQNYIPFYGLYDYGWSKTIYTAAELLAAGVPAGGTTITGVSYYVGNAPINYISVDQRVFVRHTAATAIDLTYIADPLAEALPFTSVYQGDLTWNGSGWHNILFTNTFAWNGTDNIEILWQNWDGAWASGPAFRYTSTTPTYLACYKYSDGAMPTTNGTNYYSRPNIRFLDALVSPPGPVTLLAPVDAAINAAQYPTFSWSAPTTGGIPTGYKLWVHALTNDFSGVEPILVSSTSYTPAMPLDYSTLYYWKVAATNSAADSPDSPVWSFTVRDDPTITPDYCLDFGTLTTDWPVLNWTQLTGPYGGPLVAGTQWFQDDWRNVLDPLNKCAKINIYGASRYGWLVSPPVNIPATGDYEIKFDACLVDWNDTFPPATLQPDDRFLVVMGDTPTMDNPVILGEWNNTGSPLVFNGIPAEGAAYSVPITASGIKYFAFYGESTVTGNGDNDLMIDNLCIQEVVPGITIDEDGNIDAPPGITIVEGISGPNTGPDTGFPYQSMSITGSGFGPIPVTIHRPAAWPAYWYVWIDLNGAGFTPVYEGTVSPWTGMVDLDAKGTAEFYWNDNSTLPVELSSFTAGLTAEYFVQLNWVTQSESNLIGYRVLRSEGTDVASAISLTPSLIGAFNESTIHSYSFTDTEVENHGVYNYWLESVEMGGGSDFHGPVTVSVEHEVPPVIPSTTAMRSAYPNPFRVSGSTTIEVSVKEADAGSVTIYNIAGQAVKSFPVNPGVNKLTWNGRDSKGNACGSGIYFYRLSTPSTNMTMKMVIVK